MGDHMSVPVIPGIAEQVDEVLSGNESEVHLTCCRDDLALCGVRLDGPDAEGEPTDCIRCEVIWEAEVPCGAAFCNLRSRWRAWRQS